jgi:hypothetical protein
LPEKHLRTEINWIVRHHTLDTAVHSVELMNKAKVFYIHFFEKGGAVGKAGKVRPRGRRFE